MMIIIIRNAGEDNDGSHDKDSDGKEVVTKYKEMKRWCQFTWCSKNKNKIVKKEGIWMTLTDRDDAVSMRL